MIVDGGFEQGPGSVEPGWTEFSTNFGTPVCDALSCGGSSSPHMGTYFVFLGGIDATETAYVSQSIVIPSGPATLSFWFSAPACDNIGTDTFSVSVDGNVVHSANNLSDPRCDQLGYVERSVGVGAYADGGSHTVEFRGDFSSSGTGVTDFFVDDVRLEVCP